MLLCVHIMTGNAQNVPFIHVGGIFIVEFHTTMLAINKYFCTAFFADKPVLPAESRGSTSLDSIRNASHHPLKPSPHTPQQTLPVAREVK